MTNKWDLRFGGEDFFYGKAPNVFFADFLSTLPEKGKLLLPAEGEGRNAVYAAKMGWQVSAFDGSAVAREKALKYAREQKVTIDYQHLHIADYKPQPETFDLIALVFVHLPEPLRINFHQQLVSALKPGGWLLNIAFAREQIYNKSGGPPDIELLYSKEILRQDFTALRLKQLCHRHEFLDEGHHHGDADVLIYAGRKQ